MSLVSYDIVDERYDLILDFPNNVLKISELSRNNRFVSGEFKFGFVSVINGTQDTIIVEGKFDVKIRSKEIGVKFDFDD